MIVQSQFKEKFRQEMQIQEDLSERWGYSFSSHILPPQVSTHPVRQNPSINMKLNPINVENKEVYQSEKLIELKKEVAAIEMQKKIDKITEEKGDKEINVISFMNEKIKQYNSIVDHEHITEMYKGDLEMQKIKKIKPKSPTEKLVDLIDENKEKLKRSDNLANKIVLNNSISKLYQRYSKIMYNEDEPTDIDHKKGKIFKNLSSKKKENIEENEKKVKLKPLFSDLRLRKQKKNKVNIEAPYISTEYIQNLKNMDKKILNNRDKNESFKQKINQIFKKRKSSFKPVSISENTQTFQNESQPSSSYEKEYSLLYKSQNNPFESTTDDRQKRLQRYIKGRSTRFTKPSGDKFLLKFDSEQRTKELLNKLSREERNEKQKNKSLVEYSPMYKRKLQIPDDISGENREVMESMIQEEDDIYYWTQCRNQKLNLLLKSKKKGK